MAGEDRGLFRKKALDHLASPERLDQLLRAADRRSFIPLSAIGLIVVAGFVWAIAGRVPVTIQGRGILVVPREMVELRAPGDGYLAELPARVGDRIEAGQVVARIARPDLEQELRLEQEREQELNARIELAPRRLADALRNREYRALLDERERVVEQHRAAESLATLLAERLESNRRLVDQGLLSKDAILAVETDAVAARARESEIAVRLGELRTRELEMEERHLQRLERSVDRENELASSRRELARLRMAEDREAILRLDRDGVIVELNAAVGEYVEAGDRIGAISTSQSDSALRAIAYFTVGDGKRLGPGMQIEITPETVERQRHGSIKGEVIHVSPMPVSVAEAEKVVGVREVAQNLVLGGHAMQVEGRLITSQATPSGFVWTSGSGPALAITSGTTVWVRATIESRPPISFVLPWFKSSLGLD